MNLKQILEIYDLMDDLEDKINTRKHAIIIKYISNIRLQERFSCHYCMINDNKLRRMYKRMDKLVGVLLHTKNKKTS